MSTEETKLIDITGGKVLYDDLRERIDKVPEQIPSVPDMSIHFPGNGYKLNMQNSVNSTEHASAEGYLTTASDSCAHAEGYDTTASGPYSHAEGFHTTASEEASHAEGVSTNATGQHSHSEGYDTTASGTVSHAEGSHTEASGAHSHAEGVQTVASGPESHAEGFHTTASDSCAHAEGYYTTASGGYSHAEGLSTSAIGHRSHAEGDHTIALGTEQHVFGAYNVSAGNPAGNTKGKYVEIVGNGTADNARSNARTLDWQGNEWLAGKVSVGTIASPTPVTNANDLTTKKYVDDAVAGIPDTSAHFPGTNFRVDTENNNFGTAQHATAEGAGTTASGKYSHAEGVGNTASGAQSHAEGASTKASAMNSHAEGGGTTASGAQSHAEGAGAMATGQNSHAEGTGTIANSMSSHTEGANTLAYGKSQHVFGEYNVQDGDANTVSTRATYVEIVGNGTANNARSNARTLDWQGNEWLAGKVSVGTVASPTPVTNANDLTTKKYVDDAVAGIPDTSAHFPGNNFRIDTTNNNFGTAQYATAEGSSTTASGQNSHAEGLGTTASGAPSHAEGAGTTALGANSHAEGASTLAFGKSQHVFGEYNVQDGDANTVSTRATYVEIVGNGTANNARSNARTLDWQGNEWLAGKVSVGTVTSPTPVTNANDLTTKKYVDDAVAGIPDASAHFPGNNFRIDTTNNNFGTAVYASAEGVGTTASGFASHAEGAGTTASAQNSHAEGGGTTASGSQSHAEGGSTKASGNNSHAEGAYTLAYGMSQHVFGEYNVQDGNTNTGNARATYVEIVGNGTYQTRSNARTLDWSGNEALAGSITLGKGTADEVTLTAANVKALLALLN